MKRSPKHEDTLVSPQAELDLAALMAKMQQQLVVLEKKIDSIISQPSERPFKGEHYSKPFKRFDHFRGHENRDQGNGYRERRFTQAVCADCHKECEVPFKPTGDRPVYCKDCFSKRRPGSSFQEESGRRPRREENFAPREYSDMKRSRKSQGHGAKKPVSRRRKERA